MDRRTALPAGWELRFPGLTCTVGKEVGRGANAIVYQGWYADAADARQHHVVLIKELFPFEETGGIFREADTGNIRVQPEAALVMADHQESFRWGNEIHLKLKAQYPGETGGNINTYACQGTYYTLLDFSGGRTLHRELSAAKEASGLRRIVLRGIGILDGLRAFHQMGFLHLDISPDNVILLNQGRRERVELIDYNSVVEASSLTGEAAVRLSRKQGYSSPEVRKGDARSIGPWTDLYSVAAVFYFCLMGAPLTRMQLGGIAPIRIQGSPFLAEAPATVTAQVQKILTKGLAASGKRRYQRVEEMLQDFQELLDRIDGIGITHWSLWETCASSVRQEIGSNTGLHYLKEADSLYPLQITDAEGQPVSGLLDKHVNGVLTGSGGMGKTTLFLRTAWLESRSYRADKSAVCYLPLGDYSPGDSSFIHDKLLRKMRFRADTLTYESARHTLDLLLQKPLQTKQGLRPVVFLLLDGYNEISGDTRALRKEIGELARMDGVAILIASRNGLGEYPFETWSVEPLREDTIRDVLGKNGLLLPEEPQMRALLPNPMMLNLFVSACRNQGVQLQISSRESLIQTYLKAMVEKELRSLPEDAPEGWQLKAAVECVLPLTASVVQRGAASNERLVTQVSRLYGLMNSGFLKKRYPQWSGHMGDIQGETKQAEDWYRIMIREILWRRLGLLVRDSEGQYRIFHQEFQEALAPRGAQLLADMGKRRKMGIAGSLIAVLGLTVFLFSALKPETVPSYDPQKAIDMMGYIQMLSGAMADEQNVMLELLEKESHTSLEDFGKARERLEKPGFIVLTDRNGDGNLLQEYRNRMDALMESGEKFPWNAYVMGAEQAADAVTWYHGAQERYREYTQVLERAYAENQEDYNHCCQLVRSVVEADMQVWAAYHVVAYTSQTEGLEEWETTPEGKAFAGTANRLSGGLHLSPERKEMIGAVKESAQGKTENLYNALSLSSQRRSELTKDLIYIEYAYFR